MKPKHPYLDHDHPIAIAHRGGAGPNPENTMPAFEAAVELGYRYLETDSHLTADGVVVAFHDPRLDRVSDRSGAIAELTWDQVSSAVIGGSACVPRLDELLRAFPNARFNIDAKSDEVLEPLLDVVAEAEAGERVCIASFSHSRMQRARAFPGRRFCTSASQLGIGSAILRSRRIPAVQTGADVLQAPIRFRGQLVITRRFVDRAHRDGLPVHVWTVDDPADMHRLLDLGVDGIMTDEPEVLKRVFEERDIWT